MKFISCLVVVVPKHGYYSRQSVTCTLHLPPASYGDRAEDITRIAEQRKLGRRLVRGYPVLEAEVVYAVQNEYCETPEDFIARRSRLAFLDTRACAEALPRVCLLLKSTCVCVQLRQLLQETVHNSRLQAIQADTSAGPVQQTAFG